MSKKHVIAIAGPTASGKTKLGIELAKRYNGEVISVDSRLIYKGFNIAAAKPSEAEKEGIPHHLIDIAEPEDDYTAADFKRDAVLKIEDIISRGKLPIAVGGTGLYFRILFENYALPDIKCPKGLREELEKYSNEELYEELKSKDIENARKIHVNDRIRLIRTLEVVRTLKRPYTPELKEPEYDVKWIFPKIESREELYGRINKRVDEMIKKGIVDETKFLIEKHGRIKNIINTIGYKEMLPYIDGECTLDDAAEMLKMNTRRYAKRQLTWFRKTPELGVNI